MGQRSKSKQSSKPLRYLRCGDTSYYWKDCDVDSGDDSVKHRADDFWRTKKASEKRRDLRNKTRCKTAAISGDTSANNLMSLIDYSKLVKVSVPMLNYILVNPGSHKLAVQFSLIMKDSVIDVEKEFLNLTGM